jgi:hypothetical protein
MGVLLVGMAVPLMCLCIIFHVDTMQFMPQVRYYENAGETADEAYDSAYKWTAASSSVRDVPTCTAQ